MSFVITYLVTWRMWAVVVLVTNHCPTALTNALELAIKTNVWRWISRSRAVSYARRNVPVVTTLAMSLVTATNRVLTRSVRS